MIYPARETPISAANPNDQKDLFTFSSSVAVSSIPNACADSQDFEPPFVLTSVSHSDVPVGTHRYLKVRSRTARWLEFNQVESGSILLDPVRPKTLGGG